MESNALSDKLSHPWLWLREIAALGTRLVIRESFVTIR